LRSREQEVGERRDLTGREIRALAHPLRIRLLELLREGPSTASILARRLHESTGATSYHLRELHRFGFLDEDTERGHGRERWWRRRERMLIVASTPRDDDPDTTAALGQLRSVFLERDAAALDRFVRTELSQPWKEAVMIGNWSVYASPEEIAQLTQDFIALVDALRRPRDEAPETAAVVHVSFRALPQGDE
jgi:DNA-binding transcriptional ArsR family regulator